MEKGCCVRKISSEGRTEGKSWNTRKVEPPQGYYEHTCMDHTGSLNDYTITPCDGNRKYVYMTKAYTPDPKPSLYSTYWRYQLHWGYRAQNL